MIFNWIVSQCSHVFHSMNCPFLESVCIERLDERFGLCCRFIIDFDVLIVTVMKLYESSKLCDTKNKRHF